VLLSVLCRLSRSASSSRLRLRSLSSSTRALRLSSSRRGDDERLSLLLLRCSRIGVVVPEVVPASLRFRLLDGESTAIVSVDFDLEDLESLPLELSLAPDLSEEVLDDDGAAVVLDDDDDDDDDDDGVVVDAVVTDEGDVDDDDAAVVAAAGVLVEVDAADDDDDDDKVRSLCSSVYSSSVIKVSSTRSSSPLYREAIIFKSILHMI
jgi:hypothetical protein